MRSGLVAVMFMGVIMLTGARVCAQSSAQAFLNDFNTAQEKSRAREWVAAAPLWERLVTANPHIGWSWYSLGTAQYNTGEYRKAAASFEKAFELGTIRLSVIAFDVARAHAMLKEKEAALQWLQRALEIGLRNRERIRTEEAFAFLRDDPRFKVLTAEIDAKGMSRAEGLRHDVAFLEKETMRMHYDPFGKVSQARVESEFQALRRDIPRLTDNQFAVRVMRLMALFGDGHTGLFADQVSAWKSVPIQFRPFQEGVFVIAADPKYADLLGKQVLRFGTQTPEQLIAALEPLISRDSRGAFPRSWPELARFPAVLNGLDLQRQSESLELTVREDDGTTRRVEVPAETIDPREYSRIRAHPKWATVLDKSPDPLPLYLKDRVTNYWFEQLPNSKTVYFQFNLVVNSPTETLEAFLGRLFKYIDENEIEKLIIDMRWNNGGNAGLAPPLVYGIIRSEKINQQGNLFVLVGRYTFSAAVPAASLIETHTNAILVGEPTPSGPNFIGESNFATLPYSQLRVSISDTYHQTTWTSDSRVWLAPLLYVPVTFEAYKAKRDPALEMILAYRGAN